MGSIQIAWRASKKSPCPLCRGNHSCSRAIDGLHFCRRMRENLPGWRFLGEAMSGTFGMYRDASDTSYSPGIPSGGSPQPRERAEPNAKLQRPPPDFESILEATGRPGGPDVEFLAREVLGVSSASLMRLGCTYSPETAKGSQHWLFPERDASGKIIGLGRRYLSGAKLQYPGGQRGLTYDPSATLGDAILLVEGPSDTATALTLGISAVGRPSNLGGVPLLTELLEEPARSGKTIAVVGENDQKPDGAWPGRDGAQRTAQGLADAWGCSVSMAFPPDGTKDLRSWVNKDPEYDQALRGERSFGSVAERMLKAILASTERVFPTAEGGSSLVPSSTYKNKTSLTPYAEDGTRFRHQPLQPELWSATQDILLAGSLAGFCRQHYVPLLQERDTPQHGLALRVPCNRYGCSSCAPRVKADWLQHLIARIDQHAGNLYTWQGDPGKAWATERKRIRRQHGEFLAIHTFGGLVAITTTETPSTTPSAPCDAVEAAAEALRCLAPVRLPVSTSRGWKRDQEECESKYERRGQARPGAFRELVQTLEQNNLKPHVRTRRKGSRADWVFPEDWPEERIAEFFDALADVCRREEGS